MYSTCCAYPLILATRLSVKAFRIWIDLFPSIKSPFLRQQLPNILLLQNKRATQTVIDQIAHSHYVEKELDLDQTETNFDFDPAVSLSANVDEKLALAAVVLVQHWAAANLASGWQEERAVDLAAQTLFDRADCQTAPGH